MRTLDLGILAHVDAGNTTLTGRLLYAAGVIDEIGSVDDGNTQTDYLTLVRARGGHESERRLSALIRDRGVLECDFDSYRPVRGAVPTRPRSDDNPLHRKEYLLRAKPDGSSAMGGFREEL